MALQNDTSRIQYNGNGSTVNSYVIPFVFFENSHVRAVVTTSAGVDTELTLGSGFTVTGAGNQNGGTLRTTTAVPGTSKVTIFRNVPATQTTSYQEGGDFPAASHEKALDKLTMISQQTQRQINNTLRFSEASQLAPINPPASATPHVLTSVSGQPTWETMASVNITPSLNNLTDATTVNANDEVIIQQGGISRRATANELLNGSAALIASGSSVGRTLKDRFADAVNVKDFGAVGNNSADDGPAIRAAIAYAVDNGKAVYFPKATYLISTTTTGASAIPSGNGTGVLLNNSNASTSKDLIIFGNGATIVSPLYPQQFAQPPFQQFAFFLIEGNFNVDVYNLNITSTSPNVVSQATKGRIYAFHVMSSGSATPQTVTFRGCKFRDMVLSLRIDAAVNCTVDACSFVYTNGSASTGASDWTCGIGSRVTKLLKCINCYFDGHESANSTNLTPLDEFNNAPADGLILASGSLSFEPPKILIANNYVRNFGREGIYVLGASQNSVETSSFETGFIICNNILDGNFYPPVTPRVNWAIRNDMPNTLIVNNVIRHATVGILNQGSATGAGGVSGAAAHWCEIANNHVELCPASRNGFIGAVGISTTGQGVNVHDNMIIGKNVGSFRSNGWTGQSPAPTQTVASTDTGNNTITVTGHPYVNGDTIYFSNASGGTGVSNGSGFTYYVIQRNGNTFALASNIAYDGSGNIVGTPIDITGSLNGATVNPNRPIITTAFNFAGGSYDKCHIKNNHCIIVSKNSASTQALFLNIDGNNGIAHCENNIIEGCDFITFRFGGGNLTSLLSRNSINKCTRLSAGYIGLNYGAPCIKDHLFRIYPTQTGWYQIPVYNGLGNRFGSSFDLTITTYGEYQYGNTTTLSQIGTQVTKLNFISYTDEGGVFGSTNSRLVLNQTHAGPFPAVKEAYVRNYFGGFLFYLNVNKVLSKIALTFSGGGGSNAAGYANVVNGVITSVTVTNAGSGYTSAPTVSINAPIQFGISGSGATFTAVLSANTVGSVTVGGSGGSGYAQPLDFHVVCNDLENQGIALDYPKYDGSTPSDGMKMLFSTGTKNMVLSGGGGGTVTGSGDPVASVVLSATGDDATDLITATGHAFVNGDQIGFQSLTGGAGLTDGTTYFVRDVAGNDFKVAATSGGAAINFTTAITAATIVPVMPEFIGQQFIDTTNNKIYVATGTAGGKWALLN